MKIRSADFAIIPIWVIRHEVMQAHPVALATYAAIRVLKFEHPDRLWASDRDLADHLALVVGVGAEACRKHLRIMRNGGIIRGSGGELFLPSDEPGSIPPQNGDGFTQNGEKSPHTPIQEREEKRELSSDASDAMARGLFPKAIANELYISQEFDAFYKNYPRREGRGQALKAYRVALKKTTANVLLDGLATSIAHWKREKTERRHIPLPATWLNGERWTDELDAGKPAGPNLVKMNGAWVVDNPSWRGR